MCKHKAETTLSFITYICHAVHKLSNTPAPILKLDQILVITNELREEYVTVVTTLNSLPFAKLKMSNVITCIIDCESQL